MSEEDIEYTTTAAEAGMLFIDQVPLMTPSHFAALIHYMVSCNLNITFPSSHTYVMQPLIIVNTSLTPTPVFVAIISVSACSRERERERERVILFDP